jgi:5-guanidino-2-oxopentanoate decarboxylase
MRCGEALVRLLEEYGVEIVFGIPGVHTLEYYRGFAHSTIRPILARHEQGAAFMADGYARATGRVGVFCVITGPGVTNTTTALGQAYSDSVPVLALASVNRSESLGRGWGELHETQNQLSIVEPLVGAARHVDAAEEVAPALAELMNSVSVGRPRPAFLQVPIDVLAGEVGERWSPAATDSPIERLPKAQDIERAAELLCAAQRPALIIGGGCVNAVESVARFAQTARVPVLSTIAGKGVLPDGHPLYVGALLAREATHRWLADRDLVLAVGTELAATDTLAERLSLSEALIRIDVDADRFADQYPARIAFQADAAASLDRLTNAVAERTQQRSAAQAEHEVRQLRDAATADLDQLAQRHHRLLAALRSALPDQTRVYTDMTQLAYAGNEAFPVTRPRRWVHPAGYGTLGYALPAAIGGAIGDPSVPTVALAGDVGVLYTIQEMATASEFAVPVVLIVWNNDALGQIRDEMLQSEIPPTSVTPRSPDFQTLAQGFGWSAERPVVLDDVEPAIARALDSGSPALVELHEQTLFAS